MVEFEPTVTLTRGPGLQTKVSEAWWQPDGQSPQSMGAVNIPEKYEREITRGQNIRNFHKLKSAGVLLPHTNFYQLEGSGRFYGSYNCTIANPAGRLWYDNGWANALALIYVESLPSYVPDEVSGRLPGLLQSAAAGMYSEGFDAGTALGELPETISMFKGLFSAFLSILQRKPPKVDPLSWWLELRYGVRPLIYDIQDFIEAVNNFNGDLLRRSNRAGASENWTETETVNYGPDSLGITGHHQISTTYNLSMRGSVTADIIVDRFRISVLPTAWELVTLSFVVDWFISVGQAILAWYNSWYSTDQSSSTGVKLTIRKESHLFPEFPSGVAGTLAMNSFYDGTYSLRTPALVPLLPQFRGFFVLDSLQVADYLALLYKILDSWTKEK